MTVLPGWIEERLGAGRAAIVGVGNRLRGDDGAGSRVAERLEGAVGALVFDAETVPENYLGALLEAGVGTVLFVDAADHGAPAGACCLAPARDLAARGASTHAPSIALLAGLLAARGIDAWLLGIQPATTAPGATLSPAVERAVRETAAALAAAMRGEGHDA